MLRSTKRRFFRLDPFLCTDYFQNDSIACAVKALKAVFSHIHNNVHPSLRSCDGCNLPFDVTSKRLPSAPALKQSCCIKITGTNEESKADALFRRIMTNNRRINDAKIQEHSFESQTGGPFMD